MSKNIIILFSSLIIGLGIWGAGHSIGKNMYRLKMMSRTVTVKGLAEKDVKSDLGIWDINYREVGNDLTQLDQRLQHDQQVVTNYLKQQGFSDQEIGRLQLKVEDRLANIYNTPSTTPNTNDQRYVVTAGTHVRTSNVDLIQKAAAGIDQLLQQGVPLAFDNNSSNPNPSFYFTALDSVRPTMLAEATQSAHTIAEQFAKDANVTIGGIQRASQGVFQIMSRDTSTMNTDWSSNQNALGSVDKKIRLVTTIDYRLQ